MKRRKFRRVGKPRYRGSRKRVRRIRRYKVSRGGIRL